MKAVATYTGNDTGGVGDCNTPPYAIGAGSSTKVLINQKPAILNGDVLIPSPGTTPSVPPVPCSSPRKVVASSTKVFVQGKALAVVGDVLNEARNIRIATGSSNVFVV
jgi:uncharacterized Zn-binding protein involved in type VI secretion